MNSGQLAPILAPGNTVSGSTSGAVMSVLNVPARYVCFVGHGHLEHLVFIEAAEAVWSGDPRSFGKLKDVITALEMSYELKGQTPHSAPNYTRILFTPNERRAIPIALDDRRFSVLEVSDRYAEGKPGAAAYWCRLWDQVNNGGCGAFLHELLTHPIDRALIRHPLQTEARRAQQAENLDPLMTWLVTFADCPPSLDLDSDLAPGEFRTDYLYASYLASLRGTAAARYPVSVVGFGRWLSSLSRRGLDIVNGQVGGRSDRRRTKRFPSLLALRAWLQEQAAMPE